jgi:hypothetical protein
MVPVYEMLQCAKECANRSTAAYLTFGEFCVFATELKRCYEKGYLNQTDLFTEIFTQYLCCNFLGSHVRPGHAERTLMGTKRIIKEGMSKTPVSI